MMLLTFPGCHYRDSKYHYLTLYLYILTKTNMGIRFDTLLGAKRGLKGIPYSHLVIHLGVYRTSQTGHKTGREMYCSDILQ